MVTPLTFSGSTDGDSIVIKTTDCSGASSVAAAGTSELPITAISSAVVDTLTDMTDAGDLVVCYATLESIASGGDSDDDYANVGTLTQVPQITFGPARSVAGAAQQISVSGGAVVAADYLVWTQAADCSALPSGSSSTTSTTELAVSASTSIVTLNTDLVAGVYELCYQSTASGVWTRVINRQLVLAEAPTHHPVHAVAGMATQITLSGSADPQLAISDGDLVVLQETDCSAAQSVSTGASALGPTAIANGVFHTDVQMVTETLLKVCFATQESSSDSADDFVELSTTVTLVAPPVAWPNRTVIGAAQKVRVSGLLGGSSLLWSLNTTCEDLNLAAPSSAASANQTAVYSGSGNPTDIFVLHTSPTPMAGEYKMCYKPTNSARWTTITTQHLNLIERPHGMQPIRAVAGVYPPCCTALVTLLPLHWTAHYCGSPLGCV